MQHVSNHLRRYRLLVVAGLVLVLAAPAAAQQAVNSAPLVFHNQTNMALDVEGETVEVGNPMFFPPVNVKYTWRVNAGANTYLLDPKNNKIYATKFTYTIRTPGKTSRWTSTSGGADRNGNFVAVFSQANLNTHLGNVVAQIPQGGGGPTPQQQQAAVAKILVAALAHAAADKVVKDAGNNANFFQIAAVVTALEIRNAAIRSALTDLFPRLTATQASGIQGLITGGIDGRLNYANKDQVIADLRRVDPNLGDLAAVAEFTYSVYLASRKR
jgi:hypothetical protein